MNITTTVMVSFRIGEDDELLREFERTMSDDWTMSVASSFVTYSKSETMIHVSEKLSVDCGQAIDWS